MGGISIMSVLTFTLKCVLYFVIFVAVITFGPGIPPHGVKWHRYEFEAVPFHGPLAENNHLEKAEILPIQTDGDTTLNKFKGPEAFAFKDGYAYTGIKGGDIVRLNLKERKTWETFFKYGGTGAHEWDDKTTGRALGLRFDHAGDLVVADSYLGIYKIRMKDKTAETLVTSTEEPSGRPIAFFNSVAIAKDGTVYFTSSSDFDYRDGFLTVFAGPSGRLLKYDPARRITEVLVDGVYFANGVVLSEKEDYLLYNELGHKRIMKYHLAGSKSGKNEKLMSVPGFPDNLTPVKDRFMVAVMAMKPGNESKTMDTIGYQPLLRKFLARAAYAMTRIPLYLNSFYEIPILQELSYRAAAHETWSQFTPVRGMVMEFTGDGKVLQSWQSARGHRMSRFSEAHVHDGWMYLGSPWNNFAARIPYK